MYLQSPYKWVQIAEGGKKKLLKKKKKGNLSTGWMAENVQKTLQIIVEWSQNTINNENMTCAHAFNWETIVKKLYNISTLGEMNPSSGMTDQN